jgi:GNAT superfamily N-acetyltransferase
MIEINQQTLTEELRKRVLDGFSRHAIATMGIHDLIEPIAFVAMEDGVFHGTVVVALFWGALHVKYVYVEEKYRGHGLGTRLMKQAFQYGREHNCPFAFVETMSFQASGFYQKLGFTIELTRTGFSHGTSFHYLKKGSLEDDRKLC